MSAASLVVGVSWATAIVVMLMLVLLDAAVVLAAGAVLVVALAVGLVVLGSVYFEFRAHAFLSDSELVATVPLVGLSFLCTACQWVSLFQTVHSASRVSLLTDFLFAH